jgi:hypothetical protein
MGTSVFRIRTAVDFPAVLKSDHTTRSCRAASLHAGRPDSFKPAARKFHAHQRPSQTHGGAIQQFGSDRIPGDTLSLLDAKIGPQGVLLHANLQIWPQRVVANVMAHGCLKLDNRDLLAEKS